MADRVHLTPLTPEFADAVQIHASDARVSETTRVPHPYPEGAAQAWLASLRHDVTAAPELHVAILKGAVFVGACGLAGIDRSRGLAEYGYWIAFEHWDKGYASAAGRSVADFAGRELGLRKLHSITLKRNAASIRVLEKLGFSKVSERPSDMPKWSPLEILYDFEKVL